MTNMTRRTFFVASAVAVPALATTSFSDAQAIDKLATASTKPEASAQLELKENPAPVQLAHHQLAHTAQSLLIHNDGGVTWQAGTQIKISANLLDENGFVDLHSQVLRVTVPQKSLRSVAYTEGNSYFALSKPLSAGQSLEIPLEWSLTPEVKMFSGQQIQVHASMVIDQSAENYFEVSTGELVAICL